MKWLKRLLLLVLFVAVFAAALGATSWWMAHRKPAWYPTHRATRQQMAAAAQHADLEVQKAISWAGTTFGQANAHAGPGQPVEISFTQDELNALFQKWDDAFGWSSRYDQYLSEPQLVLQDGRLIFAGEVKDLGSLLSIEVAPSVEEGKLSMPIERVLAGRLPLPQAFWDRYRLRVQSRLRAKLPQWQSGAQIKANGAANRDAAAAGMGLLLLDVLNQRSTNPVVFLPYDWTNSRTMLPVKVTSLAIKDQKLSLTIAPLSASERAALLDHIRTEQVEAPDDGTGTPDSQSH